MPFGTWGRVAASVTIVSAVVSILWFAVFPVIEPRMPFNNVQMPEATTTPANPGPNGS